MQNLNARSDLHNHTSWSDGKYAPEKIIEAAIEHKIPVIGITDHYNTKKCRSIDPKKLNAYIEDITELKSIYARDIKILCGLETHLNRFPEVFRKFDFEAASRLDYVLFEYIEYFPAEADIARLEETVKNFKCPVGLAHTDAAFINSDNEKFNSTDNMINFMRANDIFWEFNYGLRNGDPFDHYFSAGDNPQISAFFNALERNGIKVSTGSDTHNFDNYMKDLERLELADRIISKFGLKKIQF